MEAGAKAAAVPIRDKQNAVFMVSIGIAIERSLVDFSKINTLAGFWFKFVSSHHLSVNLPMIPEY